VSRPSREKTFMAMAGLVALRSHCVKRKVGCVVTDERGEKIAVGFNGGPRGLANHCAPGPDGRCDCLHAEINCLLKVYFSGPLVMYTTASPCATCAAALVNRGVAKVYYLDEHKGFLSRDILDQAGVEHERIYLRSVEVDLGDL